MARKAEFIPVRADMAEYSRSVDIILSVAFSKSGFCLHPGRKQEQRAARAAILNGLVIFMESGYLY